MTTLAGRNILVHDEWLLTCARVAIHLPTATVVLADLHLGYNAARCHDGEAVPAMDLGSVLAPLDPVIRRHGVRRAVIAGDLFEAGPDAAQAADLLGWFTAAGVELAGVAPGNHDRGLRHGEYGLPVHPEGFMVGCWRVIHGDARLPEGPVVHGHDHPRVRWSEHLSGPCYLVGEGRIVLPAFSEDAVGVNVLPGRKWASFRCAVVAGDRVLDFGEVGALRKRLGRGPSGPRPMRREGEITGYQ